MSCRIRLGFDVGSGATKVCCEYKDLSTNIATVVYEQEVVLLVGQRTREYSESRGDLCGSGELIIPEELLNALEATLRDLIRSSMAGCIPFFEGGAEGLIAAVENGSCVVESVATATAIFRLASNGSLVLDRLRSDLGLSCQLLPQDREAELGYLTALSVQDTTPSKDGGKRLVSWDSGGASFQLATTQADGSRTPLEVFNGLWGNSVTHLDLLALQKARGPEYSQPTHVGDDPNPVGIDMAGRLSEHIVSDLSNTDRHPASATNAFRDIFGKGTAATARLHGIGGPTSAFKITALVTGKFTNITPEDVWGAVERYATLTTEQMGAVLYRDLPNPPAGSDPASRAFSQPKVLVPKLVLVYTVMKFLGVPSFDFTETIGNTRAIVAMEDLWKVPDVVPAQGVLSPMSALRTAVIQAAKL